MTKAKEDFVISAPPKVETMEEFLARGGKVTKVAPAPDLARNFGSGAANGDEGFRRYVHEKSLWAQIKSSGGSINSDYVIPIADIK